MKKPVGADAPDFPSWMVDYAQEFCWEFGFQGTRPG